MTKIGQLSKNLSVVFLGLVTIGLVASNSAYAANEDNVNFSGVYEGKQAIPNSMAIYCQMDGKTMVEEQLTKEEKDDQKPSTVKKCMDKIISKINVEESAARAEAIKELDNIIHEQRVQMMVDGVGKLAVASQFNKRSEDTTNSVGETKTVADDTAGLVNVEANLTDVINTLSTLYSTEAKYVALDALKLVDPAVLIEEKEKEEGVGAHGDGASEATETLIQAQAKAEIEEPEGSNEMLNSSDSYDSESDENYVEDPNAGGEDSEQESDKFEGEEILGEYNPTTGKCKLANTETWDSCAVGRYALSDGRTVWCDESGCTAYSADGREEATTSSDLYTASIQNMSNAELDAEMNKIKNLMDEYKRYKAEVADGYAPEIDDETLQSYKSAGEKYEKLLAEQSRRRY